MTRLISKYKIPLSGITDVHWRTQDSNENSVLFYKFKDASDESLRLFKARLENAAFKLCVVNKKNIVRGLGNSFICVDDDEWMQLQKELCDHLYPEPSVKSIAITGTNGKTTTVDLIRQIAIQLNLKVLTIGTLGIWKNLNEIDNFSLTSPCYIDFRKYLNRFGQDIDIVAVEVSSHALDQNRFYDFKFDIGAWTSFSQDHLDYHLCMESYFAAKAKILDVVSGSIHISTKDQQIINRLDYKRVITVDLLKRVDLNENNFLKIEYNAKNLSLALSCLSHLGFCTQKIEIGQLVAPPGRFNISQFKDGYVVIDFAHTPDALANIGKELQNTFKEKKIITVFGCGGNRDKEKRPLMGRAASQFSDFIYLTSDNPRFENPIDIIKDIETGVTGAYEIELSREVAIQKAMLKWHEQVVLIAGKGHETYIEQNGTKTPYSDKAVVDGVINANI